MAFGDDCPVCDEPQSVVNRNLDSAGNPVAHVDCRRCGRFWLQGVAVESRVKRFASREKLSCWIRGHKDSDRDPPTISDSNLDHIVASLPDYRVADKQRILLEAIERRTKPGQQTSLDMGLDFPLAWAESPDELRYLVTALMGRGLLKDDHRMNCLITPAGWDYLDQQTASVGVTTRQVFVAMWFDTCMEDVWANGIKPALESMGYIPCRVDQVEHVDRIDAKIQAEIRASKFVVADVTGQRQGVYFEAGYAIGLGKQVVWSVRTDELEHVHFDTRQFNHVVWSDPADLQQQLAARVAGAIGTV